MILDLERWWAGPAAAKIRTEAEQSVATETAARRAELLAAREQVGKLAALEIPALRKVAAAADEKRQKLERDLTAARNHFEAARRRYGTRSTRHDRDLAVLDQELRETAPPEIGETILRLRGHLDALRARPMEREYREGRTHLGWLTTKPFTDVAGRRAELAAVAEAIAACEGLYYRAVDVPAELEKILATTGVAEPAKV
jgi:hypothetical protein